MFCPGCAPASGGAGQSNCGASLHFLPSVLSLHHIPSELLISCFLSLLKFSSPPLASFIPSVTQDWSGSDKMSHPKFKQKCFPGVTTTRVCLVRFHAHSQHLGSKLWTNLEPWELGVDKMGLICKRKKVPKTCWMSLLFSKGTFWWVKCKWVGNTRILFPRQMPGFKN